MYKSFSVKGFRCFDDLRLDNLEQVNLIAGVNNVGKTALLEALFLHAGSFNVTLPVQIHQLRGFEPPESDIGQWEPNPWDSMFRAFKASQTISLAGEDSVIGNWTVRLRVLPAPPPELGPVPSKFALISGDLEKVSRVLELVYAKDGTEDKIYYGFLAQSVGWLKPPPPPPPFPAFLHSARGRSSFGENAERYGRLQAEKKDGVVLKVLNLIEPRLTALTMIVAAGKPILHGDVGEERPMPLPLLGDGMGRLTDIATIIGNAPDGLCLLDEIENGLHHSVLTKVWTAVGEAARQFNTQVFATTHSLECIVAAHQAFSEREHYDFRLHRLARVNGTIEAVTYDKETLEAAIESGLEVR